MTPAGWVPTFNAVRAGTGTVEHGAFMDESTVEEMLKRGTGFVPTLSSVIAIAYQHRLIGNNVMYQRILDDIVEAHNHSVNIAWRAGVPIATGTDTSGEIVEELELIMHATGASILDVLPSAGRTAAELAGVADKTGVIRPGLAADILIADGDLLEEGFEVLRRPRWVLKSGKIHEGKPLHFGVRLIQERGLVT